MKNACSSCAANRIKVKVKLLAFSLFSFGLGVYVHDRITEWVRLGCRLHGLDAGVIFIVASWILLFLTEDWWKHEFKNKRKSIR